MLSTLPSSVVRVRCRRIIESDLVSVAELLARGFPARSLRFWLRVLARIGERSPPGNLAKYGYLLESDGVPSGVILLIYSVIRTVAGFTTRCNLSSWYVEPRLRCYANAIVWQALKPKDITYLNVTAAPHTRRTIEAQGFTAYSKGVFIAAPILNPRSTGGHGKIVAPDAVPQAAFEPFERELLLDHASYGCVSLWYETAERAYPFVFRPRVVKGCIPCAQLIYCRGLDDFIQFAKPLGQFLALRGRPLVIINSNGPLPGVVGKFLSGRMPKYFKGPHWPRLGDLAYTEAALFGV